MPLSDIANLFSNYDNLWLFPQVYKEKRNTLRGGILGSGEEKVGGIDGQMNSCDTSIPLILLSLTISIFYHSDP